MPPESRQCRRRVCFVTGTRAEFGLMASTLQAIRNHPRLRLQLVVTGMHLSSAHGRSIDQIRQGGWTVDATVPWDGGDLSAGGTAVQTGKAMAALADVYARLEPDVVLVVGDRVEAFAAAGAAHIAGIPVAHVHGGDRALGQVDDALRHAISKLSHIHLPATRQSAERTAKLGEDRWRIHRVGSPGIDGIREAALPAAELARQFGLAPRRYALISLHPADPDERLEERRAVDLLRATASVGFDRLVIVYPNNDPGSAGILRAWRRAASGQYADRTTFVQSAPRPLFLSLLRHAAVLVGNSSAGIIEAASFGTPVVNVGPRQLGRERNANVTDVPYSHPAIRRALRHVWNDGQPTRYPSHNLYGSGRTSEKIAKILATAPLDARLRRKLIAY